MARYTLDEKIDNWGEDRGIADHGKPMGQAIKTLEETNELLVAINTGDRVGIEDAIGDIYVTLRMQCLLLDMDMDDCIERAYNEIKDRKGYLRSDGTFIKEEEK